MKRRRFTWLLVALALFALASWLMSPDTSRISRDEGREVVFPRHPDQDEARRIEKRRRALRLLVEAAGQLKNQHVRRDPFMVGLSSIAQGGTVIIVEAAAFRDSPVGQLLFDCIYAESGSDIDEIEQRYGMDPFESVDRVALTRRGALVAGDFGAVNWDNMLERFEASSYGDEATLFQLADAGAADPARLSLWNDQLIVFDEHGDGASQAIDVIEGRLPYTGDAFPEEEAYGEIYGVISADEALNLIPEGENEIIDLFKQTVDEVMLHVDASRDVALVADVTGKDPDRMSDLARSIGGALSMLRLKARAEENHELAELLDYATVKPGGNGFRLELALPLELIKEQLGECAED